MLSWMNRSTTNGAQSKAAKIASIVQKIAESGQSVNEYFRTHKVRFSRVQYFRYKARLAAQGIDGLDDGRSQGNQRKLTPEAEKFLRLRHQENPELSLQELCQSLATVLGIEVGRSTVSGLFKRVGEAIAWPRPREPERVITAAGGFEIVAALALHLGWVEHSGDLIEQALAGFRRTAVYRQERVSKDRKGREGGRFTAAYNERADVREQRFASVEEKRENKNYSRMELFQTSRFIVERKCLGILALPLVTLNGGTRSANQALGNTLEHFCSFNYQHHTLDKFLRELKYLGLSEQLLRDQVGFWQEHWRKLGESSELPFLCYYVDGNTKPLWSQKRVKKNKVTMLGRVMGCLEQVFVHDGFGHPVYLETYAGKGPMGEHILGLMEKIEEDLEGPGPSLQVTRVLVMDAASNGVGTIRAFAEQDRYHYITALDDNQWNRNKVREQGRTKRYEYGEATLRECQIELEDSKEKGFLVVVRAICIDWDRGKTTVLITSLPGETVGASMVVKAYFARWPNEELQFKSMKSFACLHRVAGYGKKKLPDEKARERQKKLEEQISQLRQKLAAPLGSLDAFEERLALALKKQRKIHSSCPIEDGHRAMGEASQVRLKSLAREIAQFQRQIKSIEAECGKDLKRLQKSEKQWLRLQSKDFVYQIDVELDQIMAFFRISLVNICCWFLRECMGNSSMSLSKLLHTVLLLPAEIELSKDVRRVKLQRNPKSPEVMKKLEPALERLNALSIQHLDKRRIKFALV
jgi:transposase